MKRKFLAMTISLVLGLSLTACGEEDYVEDTSSTVQESTESVPEQITTNADASGTAQESTESVPEQTTTEENVTEEFSLLDLPLYEVPDVSGTTWYFVGGMLDGVEMTEDEVTSTIEDTYGGTLQFEFGDDGTIAMVQGGGTLDGTYQYSEDNTGLLVAFPYKEDELRYICVFTESDGVTMIAMPDTTGENGLYFVQ